MNKWEFFGKWLIRVVVVVTGAAILRYMPSDSDGDSGAAIFFGIGVMMIGFTAWTSDNVK